MMNMLDANDTENLIGMGVHEFSFERDSFGVMHVSLMLSDGRVFASDSNDISFFAKDDAFLVRTLKETGVISIKVWVYETFPEKPEPENPTRIWHNLEIEAHEREGSQIVSDALGVAVKVREVWK